MIVAGAEFKSNSFTTQEIVQKIQTALPDSEVHVNNPNGDGYHFEVFVLWDSFAGLSRMEQRRKVLSLFREEFSQNRLHAMTVKTALKNGQEG